MSGWKPCDQCADPMECGSWATCMNLCAEPPELERRLSASDKPKWPCPGSRLQTPPGEISFTRIVCPGCGRTADDCECHPGIYHVMLESNPYLRGGWLEHQFTKPPTEEDMSIRRLQPLMFAGLLYVLGIAAALMIATAPPAHAFTPFVCHFGMGYATCDALHSTGAKIIHVDPPLNEDADGPTESREHYNARCKPTISRRDPNTGMQHWTYAEPGCVYGPE